MPPKRPAIERFLERVEKTDSCWLWTGARLPKGYGRFSAGVDHGGRHVMAHRWSYEHFVGPIPDGLQLDHLCRNTACVNPDHLEPVTQSENLRRAFATRIRTHCGNGHPATPENEFYSGGKKRCRTCCQEYNRRQAARRKAERHARRRAA